MNRKKRIYSGFSMVEMMLLLVIVSLMLASGVTVISKKHVKVPRLASHGAYLCYINKDGHLHQEKYLGIGLDNKIMDEDTAQCVFTPPARASYLHIQATGGGGGGGASGYKGGTLFRYLSKTEVISPFGWTEDMLKLKGISLNELQTYGGKVWAYADGTGEYGDGGDGGDVYYIKQECSSDCIASRTWTHNLGQERKCTAHTDSKDVTFSVYDYEYEEEVRCYSSTCDICDEYKPCTGYDCASCTNPKEDDPNYCVSGGLSHDCKKGWNYVTRTGTCEKASGIPVDASCSGKYDYLKVDVENFFADNVGAKPPYRVAISDKEPSLHDNVDDVAERKVLRDTGSEELVCNYGNNQIYKEPGIFGSFIIGKEIPDIGCNNSDISAAFGEQLVSMGTNPTSIHSTKTGNVTEFYKDLDNTIKQEKFPMYMLTEEKGLSAFGESCTNTSSGTCGDPNASNRHNNNPTFTNPITNEVFKDEKYLQNGCDITASSTTSYDNCYSYYDTTFSHSYVVTYNYTDYYTCDVKEGTTRSECMYDYDDVATEDSDQEIYCAYVPAVVSGGKGGKGKFCALNDVSVTTGLQYKGESSIIAGIRGSDKLITGADYQTLYKKNEWENQPKGYAENGTPSQGFAEIRISGSGGDKWCIIHDDKVPGNGQGARRPVAGNSDPVEGEDAPYAGGSGEAEGSIKGSGYSESATSKKCGTNHVGYCLLAPASLSPRENGKYNYQYTWNTNYLQYGEGGDAGEYKVKIIRAFKDKDIEITLGRGGAAGSHPPDGSTDRELCNGKDGGDTIVGDILTAKGGKGGKGCIPTVTEQLPYFYEGGTFRAEHPGVNGKLASVTNYKSNILNLVLPVDNSVLGAWIAASGAGGNGGGSYNNCWASEWVRTFEGKPMTELYGPLNDAHLSDPSRKGCRIGTYWGHTPDPEAGTAGAVLIKW